jgi:hypothetical protein
MHPVLWFLLITAALIILTAPWGAIWDAVLRPEAQKLAMERRLQRFETEQRVRQQAAVMERTRRINALANETCEAMVRAALQAQREELKRTHK